MCKKLLKLVFMGEGGFKNTEKNTDGFYGRSLAPKGTDYVCHRIIKFYSAQYNYQNLVCIVRIYHGTPRAPQVVCQ